MRCALRSRGLPSPVLSNTLQLSVGRLHGKLMLFALPLPALAEVSIACATATEPALAQSIPALPACFRMLRPVHAERRRRLLQHASAAGAEPRPTLQGCRHPCVSAASRLSRPFCTRPPDFSGAYSWGVLLPVVLLFRSTPFRHRQSSGDASMAASAGARKKQDSSGDHELSDAGPTGFGELPSDF